VRRYAAFCCPRDGDTSFSPIETPWIERLDASGRSFQNVTSVQQEFEAWLPAQTAHHARWFRCTLVEPFGLHVPRTQATADGLLITHNGPNTLVVVPTEMLDSLRAVVEAEYGSGVCAALADNSAAARGDAAVMAAFRREIHVPVAAAKALRDIPEVAHVRSTARE
jgi:hypothetical protein